MAVMKGRLRSLFPGGNTSQGFYSFYDNIVEPGANKIFVIKGGPGVGKSTLMRTIGNEMLENGYEVEFLRCSSDPASLDGVYFPELDIALIDGTFPHIVDPKNPGAVDEIVHLGDYWNEDKLRKSKPYVLADNKKIAKYYKIAYSYLQEAKVIHDRIESYYTDSMNFGLVNKKIDEICQEIFPNNLANLERNELAKQRHMFITAITPEGFISETANLLNNVETLYVLKGEPGTGKSTLCSRVAVLAQQKGFATELYHCPIDPEKLDALLIPELKIAIINGTPPHSYNLKTASTLTNLKVINLNDYLDYNNLEPFQKEIAEDKEKFDLAIDKAIEFLKKAKKMHDHLESYYISAIDFDKINEVRKKILERILELSKS